MDAESFDAFVRQRLRGTSRRGVLNAGISVVATALGLSDRITSEGAKAKRSKHHRHQQRTSDGEESGRDQVQASGKSKRKKKRCKSRMTRCGKKCFNLAIDPTHCGACFTTCPPGTACRNRTCEKLPIVCLPSSPALCGDRCTDLQTDQDNCGACGAICRLAHAGATCRSGVCSMDSCDAGYADCDGQADTGCEINTQTDPNHCGGCDNACANGEACGFGVCCLPPTVDLQSAIDAAGSGATLRLCPGTWTLSSTVHIPHTKPLTIIGAGSGQTILDGGDSVGVLRIEAETKLQGLTVTNGSADQGGGIYNRGQLLLEDVTVTGNTAETYGGGIFNLFRVTLTDSRVTDNTADHGGGVAIFSSSGVLALDGASVSNNTAAGFGGGIYIHERGIRVYVQDGSTVAKNTSTFGSGGGIYNDNGLVVIGGGRENSVTGNTADDYGGGISTTGVQGTVTLASGSILSGNTAGSEGGGMEAYFTTVTFEAGSRVTGNTAGFSGGGILREGGTMTIADTTIVTDNYLSDGITVSNCAPVDTTLNCIG